MQATVGDKVHFKSRAVGIAERVAEIVEVHGRHGGPPYLVRFEDGHQTLVFPGADCVVESCRRASGQL
ncbi:DUF1918 domain-containing protein [Phaeacidiphilus oryzae]|uniref:DUF1918 domain-containing protein n=1 Tax=Phaeacidiphilus oryzae TaxID=348818 RepID=UPI00055D60C5|nr:DUF1918 domain-containing protein [Phaeacidiphilus oryzae]